MIAHYIAQFKAVYDGEPWFGDSFKAKLKGVTEKQAFAKPNPGAHAIAELISHVIYWRTPLIKRLQNDLTSEASMDDEDNWMPLEKLKAKGWKKLMEEFEASQSELVLLLTRTPDRFLNEPFRHGQSMDVLVNGVLQHDIYHLGQLGLVKKMIS
jgi:uncharacterized damage-inducible protein DinB